jgi:lipopolysaccharide transport system permease protein
MVYSLNPIVGVIDGFRWCILGGENRLYWPGLTLSLVAVVVLMISGVWYFRRTERTFADVI